MEAASVTGPAKNLIGFGKWLLESGDSGVHLSVVTFDRNARPEAKGSFVHALRAAGISTHLLHERYRFDLAVVEQLDRVIHNVRPQLIQTHNTKSHLLVKLLRKRNPQLRWLAFQHGYAYPDLKQRLYNQLDRFTLPYAERVVTVCQAYARDLASRGVAPARLRVLHNSVAVRPLLSAAAQATFIDQLGLSKTVPVILSVGRLSREKGHRDWLRALALLRQRTDAWQAVLVGSGPEESNLRSLAGSLDLTDKIVFCGFRQEVAPFLSIATLLVLPSHLEGSSNVLLEAMAAELPVIASNAGGNPEIVASDCGLLVQTGDVAGFSDGMLALLQDPARARRQAENALARVRSEFSFERYRRQLCGFYQEMTVGPARSGAPQTVAGLI